MREFVRGLFVQLQVIHALVLRETRSRFGAHQIGYLWAFIEPLLWLGTFVVLFYVTKRPTPNGMDIIGFLTTGIVPFLLFRQTTTRAIASISANTSLLYYPQIRPLDLVLARTVLEVVTLTSVFAIILSFNALFSSNSMEIESLLNVVVGLGLCGMLGASLGLTLCAVSVFNNAIERVVPSLVRPLMWISGLFFTANQLPSHFREAALWNPVLNTVEIIRDGMFLSYEAKFASVSYVVYWILGLSFLGLTLERVARRRLDVS